MKLYVAGPMRGIPFFNFPMFDSVTKVLRFLDHEVFSPAERDNRIHGTDISAGNMTGDENQAMVEHGFSLRLALSADLKFICEEADGIVMLPGWKESKGATAEHAAAEALGLKMIYLHHEKTGKGFIWEGL